MPTATEALPGREESMPVPERHYVNGHPLQAPFPEGMQQAMFGLGCFWGAERKFWEAPGVYTTAVGYAGGVTPNPTYQEVCSGMTGHNEVVLVVFDPVKISYEALLKIFWEAHNPTEGMRQGNDVGTQYRSGVYVYNDAQQQAATTTRGRFQSRLRDKDFSDITTEIIEVPPFYYAEDYHQWYRCELRLNYSGDGSTGSPALYQPDMCPSR